MKNKSSKIILTIVFVGILVFGASFARAQTSNEDTIKALQSLVQVLMQMIAQLQAQLVQKLTPSTTIPPLPDLIISTLSASKTSAAINEKITISVTEKNIGLGTANPHYVIVTEENKEGVSPIFVFNSQPLAPGESFTASGTFSCYYPGEHILTAKTNYKQAAGIVNITGIQEANETNNTKTITINCTGSTNYKCTDSDGGKNYYVKGFVIDALGFTRHDMCMANNTLLEEYCENNNAKDEYYTCPSGYTCQDGACKPTSVITPSTKCSDGSTCAWCGNQCTKYVSGMQCPQIAPPTGATCTCINNACTIQYGESALLNSLNSLTASLMNLLEFLRQ